MRCLLAIAALLLTFTMSPAYATDNGLAPDYTGNPTIAYPIPNGYRDNGVAAVQIEGPRFMWGTRKVARWIDQRVRGLKVYTHGTCARHPEAMCTKVTVRRFGNTGWDGETYWGGVPRRIRINTTYAGPGLYGTACHEFLHALGMAHHGVRGCMTSNVLRRPSAAELDAIKAYYDPGNSR